MQEPLPKNSCDRADGLLWRGKTTLLNRILSENHGKKYTQSSSTNSVKSASITT
jgi:hypothetical protein